MTSPNARQLLIERLHRQLKAVPYIHAVWLEGADAEGRADEYSDLDLWLDVDSGQQEKVFAVVREVVATSVADNFSFRLSQCRKRTHQDAQNL
ncbi:hypothetical protein ACI3L1_15815, partial [Deinococcus sp. SM5_A1]